MSVYLIIYSDTTKGTFQNPKEEKENKDTRLIENKQQEVAVNLNNSTITLQFKYRLYVCCLQEVYF